MEIADRIAAWWYDCTRLGAPPARSRPTAMPETFARDTVIGDGWRCLQALRAFFEQETEQGFCFNGMMRDFIASESGRSLGTAIEAYLADRADGSSPAISPAR